MTPTPIRETKTVKEALALADLVLHSQNAIGEITGPSGTGKSVAGRAVAERFDAVRVAAYDGMTRHQMLRTIAAQIGIEGAGAVDRLLARASEDDHGNGRTLLVIDEANKLSWRVLETIRFLADECRFAVLLIGTEMYTRKFTDARTRPLLEQLGGRIGAKRISTRHLDRAETYAHVIRPAFGDVADKELVTAFWTSCRRGNYREAVELAEECKRLMEVNGLQTLTPATVELAGKWMANRYSAE